MFLPGLEISRGQVLEVVASATELASVPPPVEEVKEMIAAVMPDSRNIANPGVIKRRNPILDTFLRSFSEFPHVPWNLSGDCFKSGQP